MQHLPFNGCDYRCEKCKETDNCSVYQKLKNKENGDIKSAVADVKKSLQEAHDMILQMAEELDIDLDTIEEVEIDEPDFANDHLNTLANAFTIETHRCLDTMRPLITGETDETFEDLLWHHTLVYVKTNRAIASLYDGLVDDAINSATVALRSTKICIRSFGDIEKQHRDIAPLCRKLSGNARLIKKEILNRFFKESSN